PVARSAPATAAEGSVPSRWGRPFTPVARSSAISGSTLAKCAPAPSSAAAAVSHNGAHLPSSPPRRTNEGRRPKLIVYGRKDTTVRLAHRLYCSADSQARKPTRPAGQPLKGRDTTSARVAAAAAKATVLAETMPVAIGLSARRAALSPARPRGSLSPTLV